MPAQLRTVLSTWNSMIQAWPKLHVNSKFGTLEREIIRKKVRKGVKNQTDKMIVGVRNVRTQTEWRAFSRKRGSLADAGRETPQKLAEYTTNNRQQRSFFFQDFVFRMNTNRGGGSLAHASTLIENIPSCPYNLLFGFQNETRKPRLPETLILTNW